MWMVDPIDGGSPGPPEAPLGVGVEDEVGCERRLRRVRLMSSPPRKTNQARLAEAGWPGRGAWWGKGEKSTQMVSISGRFRVLPQPLMPRLREGEGHGAEVAGTFLSNISSI